MVAIAMCDDDYGVDEETVNTASYFNYKFNLKIWSGEDTIINHYFPYRYCEKKVFYNKFDLEFDINDIGEMFCPEVDLQKDNFTLEGTYSDDFNKFFEMEITLSDYGKEHIEEVANMIKRRSIEMLMFYLDTSVDHTIQKDPVKTVMIFFHI